MRERVEVGEIQPPGEYLDERGALGGGEPRPVVVAEQGHPDGAVVEAERMGTDDRLLHPAVAALEDLAVLVDEEVVADVVPPVSEHVVGLDPADDRRGLRA